LVVVVVVVVLRLVVMVAAAAAVLVAGSGGGGDAAVATAPSVVVEVVGWDRTYPCLRDCSLLHLLPRQHLIALVEPFVVRGHCGRGRRSGRLV
jgi:hypothetical protein